jgi:hypothetical protein
MDEPMISRETIRERARKAYAEGKGRDAHGFEQHQPGAISVWQAEWDNCDAAIRSMGVDLTAFTREEFMKLVDSLDPNAHELEAA